MPESISLFALCGAMEWTHLPVAGGIYDQDPALIEQWKILFTLRHEKQVHEANKNKPRDVNVRNG